MPSGLSGELLVHAVAVVVGPTIGLVLVGSVVVPLLWRAAALSLALTLVVIAMVRAVALGRAEWQREAPSRQEYRQVIGRFALAFALVIVGSS